jgi:hypothetical protein
MDLGEYLHRVFHEMALEILAGADLANPPLPVRVEIEEVCYRDTFRITVETETRDAVGQRREVRRYVREVGRCYMQQMTGRRGTGGVRFDHLFEGIYWREVEDRQMQQRERALRERFEEIARTTSDPGQLDAALYNYTRQREHIRRHHYGRSPAAFAAEYMLQRYPENMTATEVEYRRQQALRELVRREMQLRQMAHEMLWDQDHDWGRNPEAEDRAMKLLESHLTPEQRETLKTNGYFFVQGGQSRQTYRIKRGRQMNVHIMQSDRPGIELHGICFLPQGGLATGDVMLGQKIALELYEADALRVANRF